MRVFLSLSLSFSQEDKEDDEDKAHLFVTRHDAVQGRGSSGEAEKRKTTLLSPSLIAFDLTAQE